MATPQRPGVVTDWATWMQSEGLTARTIKHRTETMRFFAAEGLDIVNADADDLVRFMACHADRWAAHTRANYYRVLRAWHLWLVRRGLRTDNPTDLMHPPRTPRGRPRPTSTTDLEQVLSVCNRRRTRAMVLLAAYEGLRVHEIAKMRGEYLRGGELRVIGKGGVDAALPAHPLVVEIAAQFPRSGWWFPSYRYPDEPITSQNVSTVIGDAFRRAGVPATAHQLRHWFGTQSLRSAGGNVRVAQELLRHASLATTQIYTLIEDDEKTAAVLALPTVTVVPAAGWPRGRRAAQRATPRAVSA